MAKIGSLGSLVFSVSENTVRTFDELSWKVSAKYATHDRHIKRDVLEFLGPEPGTISFKMAFSVFHGTNPLNEIKKLNKMCNKGNISTLVLGGKKYGSYKWVITGVMALSTIHHQQAIADLQGETATVTLKNTQQYPFNNSTQSVALKTERNHMDYTVETEIVNYTGGFPGDIVITEKLLNGFKMAHTGSAKSGTVKVYVKGGFY